MTCGYAAAELELPKLDLPKVMVKETVIDVNPAMQLYLPNGAVDLKLGKTYRRSMLNFSSKYDFVDNFLGFDLGFAYHLSSPLMLGVDLYDKVDFSEYYAMNEYLQRRQSIGPALTYALGENTRLKSGLNFEKTYTNAVKTLQIIDGGRNIWGNVGVAWDTLNAGGELPRGAKTSFELKRSFSSLGSDYEYSKAEFDLRRFVYLREKSYFDCRFQANYPLDMTRRPLSEDCTAGGYDTLRGYNFKEFRGEALMTGTLSYNIPLMTANHSFRGVFSSSLITWNAFLNGAKIGDRSIFSTPENLKSSFGSEIIINLVIIKDFPLKLGVTVAKAFEDRPGYCYFSVVTNYYSWRS